MSLLRKPLYFSLVFVLAIGCFVVLKRLLTPGFTWKYIVIHHTAAAKGNLETIRKLHIEEKNFPDIAYHFVINNGTVGRQMGQVEESELWRTKSANYSTMSSEMNAKSIAIVLVGNFEKSKPPILQFSALVDLTARLALRYEIPASRIIGHKDVSSTVCPGKFMPLKELRNQVKQRLQQALHKT